MKGSDAWSSSFWLVFSILVCIESYKFGLGSYEVPGSGFFPFWIGVVFGILSMISLVQAFVKIQESEKEVIPSNVNWVKIILVLTSMVVFAQVLEKLGFVVSTFLFVGVLLCIEHKTWYTVAIVAITTALATYAIFQLWLHSQLPKGILGI